MDDHTREFIELIRLDEFTRVVRVGHWFHTMDTETGEGQWEWHGPEKRMQLTRAFVYKNWLPDFPEV